MVDNLALIPVFIFLIRILWLVDRIALKVDELFLKLLREDDPQAIDQDDIDDLLKGMGK